MDTLVDCNVSKCRKKIGHSLRKNSCLLLTHYADLCAWLGGRASGLFKRSYSLARPQCSLVLSRYAGKYWRRLHSILQNIGPNAVCGTMVCLRIKSAEPWISSTTQFGTLAHVE